MTPLRASGLQLKLVALLLAIGLVPVIVSAVLIEYIAEVAQSFASNEVSLITPPLERAQGAYRMAVDRTKAVHGQIAARIAENPAAAEDPTLAGHGLVRVLRGQGETARVIHETGRSASEGERLVRIEHPTSDGPLVLEFVVDGSLTEEFQKLGLILEQSRRVQTVRSSLPASYRTTFIVVVGGFALILTTLGVWLGRGVTRRIEELVVGFRAVADGDMSVRVSGRGSGELGEMGRAFNKMVADLEGERRKSAYLQRIGTWQDVARKLAHEIKNPLTPIQLAVQQIHSSYDASDEKFAKLLDDVREIVTEEIDNLRRLVDAFRELGRLPRVEAKAIELAIILDDLRKDPTVAEQMQVDEGSEPMVVLADRLLLRRVLHNLVENGIQAGGSPVRVSWRETGTGRAEILVEDSGSGISAELHETLFEPYVTTKETGTGLGLAISKKIAIEHGGSLELSSESAPAGGARFILCIPLADDA